MEDRRGGGAADERAPRLVDLLTPLTPPEWGTPSPRSPGRAGPPLLLPAGRPLDPDELTGPGADTVLSRSWARTATLHDHRES
ncbi:hypothetical protein [Saccharothrix longispora]|uniref:hypothetical protein n=1 Tax=Saccharothrix longispora TaxID=33920 RepID=UPI0028FD1AB4|nr:hypothetical protein [Saccharothrix longispora]MDU0287809.1 hypothetical protein [Saccharothrix longispora]